MQVVVEGRRPRQRLRRVVDQDVDVGHHRVDRLEEGVDGVEVLQVQREDSKILRPGGKIWLLGENLPAVYCKPAGCPNFEIDF